MSKLTSSRSKGLPVLAKRESTTCSALMRSGARATKSGSVCSSSGRLVRWYACEAMMSFAMAFVL